MADEQELELDNSGKKKKLILIIAVVLVVVIGAGVGFMMMGGEEPPAEDSAMQEETGEAVAEISADSKAFYVPLPRPFRFNVPGEKRDRLVEIRVQLLVRGPANEEVAKKHIPLIESTLLSVFSLTTVEELSTSEGKIALKEKALKDTQMALKEIEDSDIVEKVLFTGFVMQ